MKLTAAPDVITWASTPPRAILNADGSANQSTPLDQAGKTLEEVSEAQKVYRALYALVDELAAGNESPDAVVNGWGWAAVKRNLSKKDAVKIANASPRTIGDLVSILEAMLALELGDILVTLVIGASMQGWVLGDCIPHEVMSVDADDNHRGWDNIDLFAQQLSAAIAAKSTIGIATNLLSVVACVEDAAGELGLTADHCLTLAYEKIASRQGAMVEGQFVKGVRSLLPCPPSASRSTETLEMDPH